MGKRGIFAVLLLCAVTLCGCSGEGLTLAGQDEKTEIETFEAALPGEYDSADTAVITNINKKAGLISFYNYDMGKYYTLNVDSVTRFSDKYDSALSIDQLKEGTIADILFLKSGKLLVSLKESADTFSVSDVTGFSIDAAAKIFTYKSESYKLSSNTVVLGSKEDKTLRDLDEIDVVTLVGKDSTVYAIRIDKGHGYLKLKGQRNMLDGVLEAGLFDAAKITEKFEMTLPEGKYDVTLSKGKTVETRKVVINADEETLLDISDIKVEEVKTGKVLFDVYPSDASVFVDGALIDNSKIYEYGYGMHKLVASAKGFEEVTRYFNVGEEQATLPVKLEEKEEKSDTKEEDKTEGYFIFISTPSGVEVSFDGNYIGMTPLSIPKKSGNHTITLRKNGCLSRTYNVNIENTAKDVYYNFEALEEDNVLKHLDVSSNQSVSGNSGVSGNN